MVWRTNTPKRGQNRRRCRCDPACKAWGIVYILKRFHFRQKGKVHLLNIQIEKCHRNCHREKSLKWGKEVNYKISKSDLISFYVIMRHR